MTDRRRLLVSLFNPEEVRAAVAGGADVIDCEDATAKVGMFRPRTIGDIAYAVRQNDRAGHVRISANIGFELRLYQRDAHGRATPRSLDEVTAKAAQEVLGIATAMDTGDHRPNVVKCGINELPRQWIEPVVRACKQALAQSYRFQNHQLVVGILETHQPAWNARKTNADVISRLAKVGQFVFDPEGPINVKDFLSAEEAKALMDGVTDDPHAALIEPMDHAALGWPLDQRERLKMAVEAIHAAGGDGVMIDTPVSAKMAGIKLVRHRDNPADPGDLANYKETVGVFDVPTLRWLSEYCAYNFLETWLAGSINVEDAAALSQLEHVDVVLNRGTSSEVLQTLYPTLNADGLFTGMTDARYSRRIRASNVAAMAAAVATPMKP